MKINEKLVELRKARGWTQEHVAKLMYVTKSTVCKWELGDLLPKLDQIKEIVNIFEVTYDYLLSDTDTE